MREGGIERYGNGGRRGGGVRDRGKERNRGKKKERGGEGEIERDFTAANKAVEWQFNTNLTGVM